MIVPTSNAMAIAVVTVAVSLLAASGAEARRGVKPYYSESYETKGPARGYEGFLNPDYYCSYKRYPNRECSAGANGKERCRVTGWRLEQTCQ